MLSSKTIKYLQPDLSTSHICSYAGNILPRSQNLRHNHIVVNMEKEWLLDIPVEIRILVYRHLFSGHTVRMHSLACSCDSHCSFHTGSREHSTSALSTSPLRRDFFGPDLLAPRCVHIRDSVHTNLFLISKTILNEAQRIFYDLTDFQTHPACVAELPDLLDNFTLHDANWRIGYLCDLKPHEYGLLFCASRIGARSKIN